MNHVSDVIGDLKKVRFLQSQTVRFYFIALRASTLQQLFAKLTEL